MAKGEEIPKTTPAEVENLIEQILGTNLDPSAKEKLNTHSGSSPREGIAISL